MVYNYLTTYFPLLTTTCMQQQKGKPPSELMPSPIFLSLCLLVWPADLQLRALHLLELFKNTVLSVLLHKSINKLLNTFL